MAVDATVAITVIFAGSTASAVRNVARHIASELAWRGFDSVSAGGEVTGIK